jgi:hypothetical protein
VTRVLQRSAILLLASTFAAYAQQPPAKPALPASPTYTFSFEREGLPVHAYTIVVARDGSGRYSGEEIAQRLHDTDPAPAPQPFSREFSVSAPTATKIAALAHELHNFNVICASKAKNIADTGKKRLSYAGPDGQGSCDYNYSENKNVQALTDIFIGLAETMDQGRHLEFLRRYDRLGLDEATEQLAQELAAGRALEVGTIAPVLRSIANNAEVMQRVRNRAKSLLASIPDISCAYNQQQLRWSSRPGADR